MLENTSVFGALDDGGPGEPTRPLVRAEPEGRDEYLRSKASGHAVKSA
jgi:hypothetical protein